MAQFKPAFQNSVLNEGGYANDPQDPGGETYKGIARNIWSKWQGWTIIDQLKKQSGFPAILSQDSDLQELITEFYLVNFWNKIKGDDIGDQQVAESIFDFAINAGVGTSATLAQLVTGVKADGIIGPHTVEAINQFHNKHFLAAFTVAKIARYVTIVKKRPTSRKYFYGWVIRALGETA